MKITRIALGIVLTIFIVFTLILISDSKPSEQVTAGNRIIPFSEGSGTAVIMTGAAARIPQQAALLEELYDRGLLNDVVFISGVSAGAINAVALNGILDGKLTWDEYKKTLFSLTNNDVFLLQEGGKLPVNTEPVRKLYNEFVEKLGYQRIGDLPIMTEISFANYRDLKVRKNIYRMCSRKINEETDTTLNLVDIMMASSAIPIAFPPVRIGNVSTIPDLEYVDGGFGIDYVPFKALLDFQQYRGENVNKVYIISRKSGLAGISEELKILGIDRKTASARLESSLDNVLWKILINRLTAFAKEAPEMIFNSYVWIPDFEQDFLLFNFNNLEEQYLITRSWAQYNDPVPLGDFLLYNKLKKKN